MTNDNKTTRKAALKILKRGLAYPAEIAAVAGVSRQLVNYWIGNLDWQKARKDRIAKLWQSMNK